MDASHDPNRLVVEGELRVVEQSGLWGVYSGERIIMGPGDSFRDDLGVKIREIFEAGASEKLASGESPSEAFSLPRVRVTIELLPDDAPASVTST